MRLPLVLRSLASGLCVYVLAAACAATEHRASFGDDGGGGGGADEIRDAIAEVVDEAGHPVRDAKAGPSGPDVATESCTTVLSYGGGDVYFAVHSYPGKTRTELASVRHLFSSSALSGYTDILGGGAAFIRDGSVAVYCAPVSDGPVSSKVTFVLP